MDPHARETLLQFFHDQLDRIDAIEPTPRFTGWRLEFRGVRRWTPDASSSVLLSETPDDIATRNNEIGRAFIVGKTRY